MTYITGQSAEVQGLLDALGIKDKAIQSFDLNIEPDCLVRLTTTRLVTGEEIDALTHWVLRSGIEAVRAE